MEKKAKVRGKKISETKKKVSRQAKEKMRHEIIEDIEKEEQKTPFVIKNLMWAPVKYKEIYVKEMLDYFQSVVEWWYYEYYTEEQVAWKDAKIVKVIKKRAKSIPMFEKYALSIGVDDRTLINWAIKKDKEGKLVYPNFFRSYKQCLSIQAMMLKELGMNWQYVSNIVKLLLSAEHSIYEVKEENDNTDKWKKQATINDTNIDDNLQDILN